jgi:hypothetical protein
LNEVRKGKKEGKRKTRNEKRTEEKRNSGLLYELPTWN